MNCPYYFRREYLDYSSHTTITDFYHIECGPQGQVMVAGANVSIIMFLSLYSSMLIENSMSDLTRYDYDEVMLRDHRSI